MLKRALPILMLASIALAFPQPRAHKKDRNPDGMRTLTGIVTDQDARPISQAAVQIENEKTLQVRSYITEAHGEFHFSELSPDADYDLQAVFDNIRSPKKTLSQFDERPHPTMTLVIRIPK
jgi:protocatechuate 3,4-dioxygenase beta subunit